MNKIVQNYRDSLFTCTEHNTRWNWSGIIIIIIIIIRSLSQEAAQYYMRQKHKTERHCSQNIKAPIFKKSFVAQIVHSARKI